jgi:hypothetical protein
VRSNLFAKPGMVGGSRHLSSGRRLPSHSRSCRSSSPASYLPLPTVWAFIVFTTVGSEEARFRAGLRPPLKLHGRFSRMQLSRRRDTTRKQLSSWVGACPGDEESAGVSYNHRSPKGNRHNRRVLNQTANAAARTKGSIFEIVYRRSVPRLGHNQTIGIIAHRQCRLIWLILHQGVRYEERGPAVTKQSKQKRMTRMIRQLRSLGYRIEPPNPQPSQALAQ